MKIVQNHFVLITVIIMENASIKNVFVTLASLELLVKIKTALITVQRREYVSMENVTVKMVLQAKIVQYPLAHLNALIMESV